MSKTLSPQGSDSAELTEEARTLVRRTYVELLLTVESLKNRSEEVLKPFDLTEQQCNVLYILNEAGEDGIACQELANHLVKRDPDITRLLDRLEARKLTRRTRSSQDRRIVLARITPAGRELVEKFIEPFNAVYDQMIGPLGVQRMREVCEAMQEIRGVGK